jgi:transcriptional regulator with XRE-family HTH domain
MPGQTGPRRKWESNFLGEYLRSLREQQGLTTRKLSITIDRTEAYINRIELGKRRTDLAALCTIVTALSGDFLQALACLCRDEGVPEEEVARIVAGDPSSTDSSKSSRTRRANKS